MIPQGNIPRDDREIAQAVAAIGDMQGIIYCMLLSIWQGTPRPGPLDDSDFREIMRRHKHAMTALKVKYGIY